MFDGAHLRGTLNAIMKTTFIRYGSETREGISDKTPVDSASHFDRIVIPGDFIQLNEEKIPEWDVRMSIYASNDFCI